jgi:hypothetical protein
MKKLLLITSLFLLSHTVFSQVKTNFTQQDYAKFFKEDCIPKDLTAEGLILLVQSPYEESAKEKNNEINEIFKTYYKFPFVVVPVGVKDFKKTYENTKVYKYSIGFTKNLVNYENTGTSNDIEHVHYELTIIDRVKLSKNTLPEPPNPKTMSRKEQEKYLKEMEKNMDKYNIDPTAIQKTGLEDNESKLAKMLTFLVKKLGKYKGE